VSESALATHKLTKFYGTRAVVRELDWSVPVGTACALLGPNGAGKSTTLKLLLGFTPASGGTARILGADPFELTPALRTRIGYVSERAILPPWARVERVIAFHASLYPRWNRALEKELGAAFTLHTRARVAELSKGQNRSLMLLLALCQGADLLLLDEPASGLDVAARRQFLGLLADYLAEGGRSLVLSTHLLGDVERLASHVTILRAGTCVAQEPLDELKRSVKRVRLPLAAADQLQAALAPGQLLASETAGRSTQLTLRIDSRVEEHLRALPPGEAETLDLPLEEIYLALTGPAAS
jgi:ABC-2 type transport system ATP-binding protein